MYRLLENYGKTIMIVVAVGLMIVFVLPAGLQGLSAPSDPLVGTYPMPGEGEVEIYSSEVNRAENRAINMSRLVIGRQGQVFPLAATVLPELIAGRQGVTDPLAVALLFREADAMGTFVDPDSEQVTELLLEPDLLVQPTQGVPVPYAEFSATQRERDNIRIAAADYLRLRNAANRVVRLPKTSTPLVNYELARQVQEVRARYNLIDAEPLVAEVGEPSDAQVQALFEQYADTQPGQPTTSNPLGLGYRLADRVKLHALIVPADAVDAAVDVSLVPDDPEANALQWEIEANKHYQQNPQLYPILAATTQPATQPDAPTVRPFEEVREQAIENVKEPRRLEMMARVTNFLRAEMSGDLRALLTAEASDQPLDMTATHGADPRTFEYLTNLAEDTARRFNIRPKVVRLDDRFRDGETLLELPEIENAEIPTQQGFNAPLALVVLQQNAEGEPALQAYQPTPAMLAGGDGRSRLIARVVERAPAGPATDLDAARPDIVADWKRLEAMLAAAERANQQLVGGLPATAAETDYFGAGRLPEIPDLPPAAVQRFANESFKLLATEARTGTIKLPGEMTVAAVELTDARPTYESDDELTARRNQIRQAIPTMQARQLGQLFGSLYGNPDRIIDRLGFTYAEGFGPQTDEPEATDEAPAT
jgi:hypothetical protein